jgi:hypothetical protein
MGLWIKYRDEPGARAGLDDLATQLEMRLEQLRMKN